MEPRTYDELVDAMIRKGEVDKLEDKLYDPDDPYNAQDARSGKGE